jgi:exopolysaccharide biosynthesis polyprenyl glycosylphosphotransferase
MVSATGTPPQEALAGLLTNGLDEPASQIFEPAQRGARRPRGWLVRRALLAADLLGLACALAVPALIFGVGGSHANRLGYAGEYAVLAAALPAWVLVAKLYGLYDRDEEYTDHSTVDDISGVFQLVTLISWLLVALIYVLPVAQPAFGKILTFWAAAVLAIPLARASSRCYCRRRESYTQNTVIVGAGDVGQLIARKLLYHPEYGINVVGFVDAEPKERGPGLSDLTLLGAPEDLPDIIERYDVTRVIIAFSREQHRATLDLIRDLKDLDMQVDVVPRLFELVPPELRVHQIEGLPVLSLPPFRLSRSSRLIKRSFDLALTVPALIILSPVFAVIAALIKLDSPGPVFFRQIRMGVGGEAFRIYKFRSMRADADERKHEVAHLNKYLSPGGDPRMFKIPDDPRVTRVGHWLRRLSLDELPQLINVVRGEMSLVGARPLILEEDQHIEDWGRRRLDLSPGITGLWQVLGRNNIPFEEMLALDYRYVTNWSLGLDLRLILRTIPVLVRPSRGAV